MRRRLLLLATAGVLALGAPLRAVTMSVDSLDGPVTTNEVNSFITYIQSISPVVWPNTGSMENQYAQGASGEQIKAMGLMYEITGNTTILNRMIYFCDTLLSQRNDLLAAPNGQRVYWNGKISPAWPGQALGTATVYSTSASGDCVGHLANCARLILQTPSLWSTTVPDGNPYGYGATYLARAQTYVTQADYTFTNCFFPDMLTLTRTGLTNVYCYPTGYPYQGGNQYPWNQAMMMSYPLQNLAIAHSLLGDNPSLVTQYDTLVRTNVGRFFSDPAVSQLLTDSAGNLVYDWAYNPSANGGEDSNHGALDVAGFYRAYATGRYGITASEMTPFANMVVDIMTLTVGTYYAGTVEGCTTCTGHAATTTYLRSGYFFAAEFRPDQYYNLVQGLHITAPGTTGSIDAFSRLMWIKNRRYVSTLPSGWNHTDIGSPALAGSASYSGGTYTLNGCGADIYGTADQFQYAYAAANGDVTVTARVATQQNTNGWAKSGVMIRESTAAGSTYVGVYVTPAHGIDMQYRATANGSAADLARLSTGIAPYWVRLVRSGNTFTGYASADGSTWTQVGSTSVTMSSVALAGLADCSHSTSALCTTTFDNVSLAAPTAQVAAPTFSPAEGSYTSAQNVTISTTTSGATIRYTLDGSTPTSTSGTLATGAVSVTTTTTLKAIAYASGMTDSPVASGTYTIGATNSNVAPSGTAYGWSAMTSSTANTGKVAMAGLNDNNLTTSIDIRSAGDSVGAWEAAGVTWSTARTIASASFINGDITSGGDGFLTANCKLQFTTDGSTWTDSGWTLSPAYPYSSSAGGQTYTFSGTAVTGKLGARVVGQVRTTDTSYHWLVKEVQFVGQ